MDRFYFKAAAFFLGVFLAAGAAFASLPDIKGQSPARAGMDMAKATPQKTVFDLSHGEVFSPVKDGPLDYSGFVQTIRKAGEEVSTNPDKITKKSLVRVRTYIIAGPTMPFAADEIGVLQELVRKGGNLVVLLHISSPVAQLTESFGIIVSNFVIADATDTVKGEPQDFYVTRFSAHPVTQGLKKIAVFGCWGLMGTGEGKVIAKTSEKAWADANRNRVLDPGEPVQSFGIIAVSELGKGRVVVVADDAPFSNKFYGEADNALLAGNIVKWLGGGR